MKKYIKPETLCVEINSAAMMTELSGTLKLGGSGYEEVSSKYNSDDTWDDED